METVEKKPYVNELKQWLGTVPTADYLAIKRQIIEKCKTTDYIFRNWKCGITRVPLLERSVINQISQTYNQTTCFELPEP